MTQHTPGPWVANEHDWVEIAAGGPIADVYEGSHQPPSTWDVKALSTRTANARLIAAAPDMLEALKLVWKNVRIEDAEAGMAVAKAIAKATGAA